MAVITRYIVVRNGVELDKVFEVKKEADAYDKMLDAAEDLAAFIKKSGPELGLDEKAIDDISIHLAKNALEVNKILRGVKTFPPAPTSSAASKPEITAAGAPAKEKKNSGRKPKTMQQEK